MDHVRYLVVGAGVSGLSFANFIESNDVLVLEADTEIGGYCKTIRQDGFVWDYSGHFFHFKNKEIERWLVDRMPADEVRTIAKSSRIVFGDRQIEFPFQKNIHQLAPDDFLECLTDLYFKEETWAGHGPPTNFAEMLYRKFGRGIAEKFLIPYNTKLYAVDLATLDVDAMGRFFPHASTSDIIRNFRTPDNSSYNATFTYPRGGAIQYVNALKAGVPDERIQLGEALVRVDPIRRVATTTRREIRFEHLVSSAPFDRLASLCGLSVPDGTLSWNKVLVFNLGFDRKSWDDVHWVYFPEAKYPFYRIGFYDNIFGTDRLSLYVEIGYDRDAVPDVDASREAVLAGLREAGVIDAHQLVSEHHIVLDPAYVHITRASQSYLARAREILKANGIHTTGRYGSWTYCSIEDNILEARDLAAILRAADGR